MNKSEAIRLLREDGYKPVPGSTMLFEKAGEVAGLWTDFDGNCDIVFEPKLEV